MPPCALNVTHRTTEFNFWPAGFQSCFGPITCYFPAQPVLLYLEVCNLFFGFLLGFTAELVVGLRGDFGLRLLKLLILEKRLNAFCIVRWT
jgi:hypothetical protein